MFLEAYSAMFGEIIMIFLYKNGRLLEIEGKVSLTLLINSLLHQNLKLFLKNMLVYFLYIYIEYNLLYIF